MEGGVLLLRPLVYFYSGVDNHYFRPMGLPRAQQPWLATVLRKPQ